MKAIFIFLSILRFSNIFSQNELSYYLNLYNQSSKNLTVISISGNECVNCYASIHYLLNDLKMESTNTLFLVKDVPKRELGFFMEDKFNIDTAQYRIIIDNLFFSALNNKSGFSSSISVCNDESLLFQTEFKNIDIVSLKKYLPGRFKIQLSDSLDVSNFAGAGASMLQVKNDSLILIYNYFRSAVFEYNLNTQKITKSIAGKNLKTELNDYLMISELDPSEINFANTNTDAQQMFKTVPSRIAPRNVYVTENYIYLALEVLSYDLVIDNKIVPVDTSFQLKWFSFFAKYDRDWNLINRYSFPYQISEYKPFFNYLPSGQFLNDSIFIMRASTASSDSLAIEYLLPNKSTVPKFVRFLSIKYPDYFPVLSKGMRNVYSSEIVNDEYFFNTEPIVYNDVLNFKHLLEGWDYQSVSDSSKTNTWIDIIEPLNNGNYLVLGTKNYTSTWYALYDKNFMLIEQKKIIDRPLISMVFKNNKIWGMDLTEEYGTLYSFEINYE